ncbi:ATP-binding protein [Streptomyces olivaceus]|uniref:ATP-binding protein n=1 Tax=Streptomyces olivaceus TaxID=47716 RepID=UPI002490730E|nr:ATP-binding protein [Streptomyces olivaceus]
MSAPRAREAVTVSVFAQRFSATRRGARLARRLATHQLALWHLPYGSPASDTITLVVSELAANAALHGCVPGRDFELRLVYDRSAGFVRVEVSDTHPELPAPTTRPAADDEGGRGLLLVAAVADRWGVERRTGPGKTVWAECAVVKPATVADRPGMPHCQVVEGVDPLALLLAEREDDRR